MNDTAIMYSINELLTEIESLYVINYKQQTTPIHNIYDMNGVKIYSNILTVDISNINEQYIAAFSNVIEQFGYICFVSKTIFTVIPTENSSKIDMIRLHERINELEINVQ